MILASMNMTNQTMTQFQLRRRAVDRSHVHADSNLRRLIHRSALSVLLQKVCHAVCHCLHL